MASIEFVDPTSGRPVLPTMTCALHRVVPTGRTASRRKTGSSIFVVYRGRGRSVIGSQAFEWSAGDMFVVPSWYAVDHEAETDSDLFEVSDEAALRALHLFREETLAAHQDIGATFEPRALAAGRGLTMRLATLRTDGGTRAVRVDEDRAVEIAGAVDVGALLADPSWADRAASASGAVHDPAALDYAPLVPQPNKIVCVGLNYRNHILESGLPVPEAPTLFAKFSAALVGARDPIVLPSVSDRMDWEAELAVVIGRPAHAVPAADADERHRRVLRPERRLGPRLAVPHDPVAGRQDVRVVDAARPVARHARRPRDRRSERPATSAARSTASACRTRARAISSSTRARS